MTNGYFQLILHPIIFFQEKDGYTKYFQENLALYEIPSTTEIYIGAS
jgi:hypothetical protein